jgi:hypothetical protein
VPVKDTTNDSGEIMLETETGHRGGSNFVEPDSGADEMTIEDRSGRLAQQFQPGQQGDAGRAKVVIVSGSDEGRKFELTGRNVSVGRGMDNDIVLTDLAVSRRHLRIDKEGQSYFLQDQGSGNGTLLNGRDEDGRALLRHGDRIEIGNTVMRFEFPRSLGASAYDNAPTPQRPEPSPAFMRARTASSTHPPIPPGRPPDEVETMGQRPFSPRPSEAPPIPAEARPSSNLPPMGGFSPIPPAQPYGAPPLGAPERPSSPAMVAQVPPAAPPLGPPAAAAQTMPPGMVPTYPQAPPNFANLPAAIAARPRSGPTGSPYPPSPSDVARPVVKRSIPWVWIGAAVGAAALGGTLFFFLQADDSAEGGKQPPQPTDVKVVATDAGAGAVKDSGPPKFAILTNTRQPQDLPKEMWGTDETQLGQAGVTTPPVDTTPTPPVDTTPTPPVNTTPTPPVDITPTPPVDTTPAVDTTPTPATGDVKQVRARAKALYQQEKFSDAAAVLKDAAKSPSFASNRKSLTKDGNDYAQLAALMDRGARSNGVAAYRAYSEARRVDAKLGGAHRGGITSRLKNSAYDAAKQLVESGDYGAARDAASMAGERGQRILDEIEDEARRFVEQARVDSVKGDKKSKIKAQALLKKARNMVPEESDVYRQATEILERLGAN